MPVVLAGPLSRHSSRWEVLPFEEERVMKRLTSKTGCAALATALFLVLNSPAAMAEKPEWAGGGGGGGKHGHKQKGDDGGGGKHAHKQKGGGDRREVRVGHYFDDGDRRKVRVAYGDHYGGGKGCPPGLAKKNNGCMPPGQAKKYNIGQPLPTTVVYYPVPQPVLVTLPPPPIGHKYVRVAADILLIAVGTSMVVDAITDLSRL
jgi:Ni/Co efflux regulator RcnB